MSVRGCARATFNDHGVEVVGEGHTAGESVRAHPSGSLDGVTGVGRRECDKGLGVREYPPVELGVLGSGFGA